MPRVSNEVLDVVVYVYPDRASAERSERVGATGFLVGVALEDEPSLMCTYVVTNRHAVAGAAEPHVRVNKPDGGWDFVSPEAPFTFHSDGDDVAIAPIGSVHHLKVVLEAEFCTRQVMADLDMGIGNDCHFVGRFASLSEDEARGMQNVPTVRFGTIAAGPLQITQADTGIRQESFLVEARSLSGYSGSPVFVWDIPRLMRPLEGQSGVRIPMSGHGERYLLGIDWGHLQEKLPVRDESGQDREDGSIVLGNSGMMCVVPSWKIAELLHEPEQVAHRAAELAVWRAQQSPER